MHPDLLVPDWPAPSTVRALCTTRAGGVSAPPFDTFNLGDHVGDDPAAVAANRARLTLLAAPARPVFLRQVHGIDAVHLRPDTPDGAQADAALVTGPGLAATIMVADCLPLLLCNARGSAVAAAHAGWRGLAGGVIEAAVAALRGASPPGDALLAWLGPCIGPDAFEVGDEVKQAFVSHDPAAASAFRDHAPGKHLADLAALARQRLAVLGVGSVSGNDSTPAWCTVGQASRFFSHRRDAARLGSSGRLAACIWLA